MKPKWSSLQPARVPVKIGDGQVSPVWVRFSPTIAPSVRLSTIRNLSEEIAMALPQTVPNQVGLLSILKSMPTPPPCTTTVGLADDGPLWLQLPSPDIVHVLVAGATGAGKTELMRTMAVSLALTNHQRRLQLALIDTTSRGFAPFAKKLPHLLGSPAFDMGSANVLLRVLNAETDKRAVGETLPRIVVMVEEVVALLLVGGPPTAELLIRLAQRGREVGIHLVVSTQKPSAEILRPLKSCLPARLVGRVENANDARNAAGIANCGAEELTGRGDFIAVADGKVVSRFQAAYLSDQDWAQLPSLLKNK